MIFEKREDIDFGLNVNRGRDRDRDRDRDSNRGSNRGGECRGANCATIAPKADSVATLFNF